jgi:hypothetical protein
MHLGKELLRTCCAGVVVHLVVVAACSADGGGGADGAGDDPAIRLTNGSDAGRTPGQSSGDHPTRANDAGQPSLLIPVAEAKANESGSRLKARWYVGDDGSRQQFLNWHDSELQVDCGFTTGRDGTLRCLPTGGGGSVLSTQYADSSCTQPLFSQDPEGCNTAAPAVGLVQHAEGADVCAAHKYRYYTIGAVAVPQVAYIRAGGECVSTALHAGHSYWAAGSEIPLSRFVSGQVVTE